MKKIIKDIDQYQSDAYELNKLIEKHGHHYHEDEPTGRNTWCLMCQAFITLENMQGDVSHAIQEKRHDYAFDNLKDFPF